MLKFEMKYNNLIKDRLDAIELAMEDVSMEQARLNSHASFIPKATNNAKVYSTTANSSVINTGNPTVFLREDSKFDENALFPPNSASISIE